MPSLHCPVVSTNVPSASRSASRKTVGRLPLPDLGTGGVQDILERVDAFNVEPPTEVPGRRRVGDPSRPEGVERALVVPQIFQMLEPRPSSQKVVGDVQDVVRFVVRQVNCEQAEPIIDLAIEAQPVHEQVNRADPACRDRPRPVGERVPDDRRSKFRPSRCRPIRLPQPPGDSFLACFQLTSYLCVHSKLLHEW